MSTASRKLIDADGLLTGAAGLSDDPRALPLGEPSVPLDMPSVPPLQTALPLDYDPAPRPASSAFKTIARNFVSLGAAAIIGRLVALICSIYRNRIMGAEAVGQISWSTAAVTYFLVLNPGLEIIAKREVARRPGDGTRFVSTLFMVQMALAVITFALVLGFAALKLRGPEISILLALQAIQLVLAPINLGWLLQAHERMAIVALVDGLLQILTIPALFLFIHNPHDTAMYVLLPYPFRIALAIFTFWYAMHHRLLDWRTLRPTFAGAGWLIREALPLGISQVAIMLYYNSATILLGVFLARTAADEQVGYYTTAFSLMTMTTFFSSALLTSFFPTLARCAGNSDEARAVAYRTSSQFLRILAWIGFPCAAIGWVMGKHAVRLLYGTKFEASGPLLEWLSIDVALIFFNVGISQPLTAWGKQKLILAITLTGAAVNVAFNCALIPRYGAYGAVVATILAEAVVFGCCLLARRGHVPIPWLKLIYKPMTCCIAVASLLKLVPDRFDKTLWPLTLAAACLTLFGCFAFLERQTMMPLLQRFRNRRTAAI